uniref:Uncharacterized protein n=1 Tax=Peronospora matthiolae TaxID=2874970 RepID=A0AAV1TR22_9STRA
MWTHVLRRVVRAEERQFDTRRRQQLAQAQSTASSSSTAIPPVAGVAPRASQSPSPIATASSRADKHQILETENSVVHTESEHRYPHHQNEDDEDDEGDGDYLQKHLLSRSTSVWSCLEDTQQANCLALNASLTLLAVGERDGRVTIWDNTTIRVITRELDPTLIAVPVMYGQSAVLTRKRDAGEALTGGEQHAGLAAANELVEGKKKEKKEEEEEEEEEVKTLEREGIATTAGNEDSGGIGGRDEMGSGGAGLTLVDLQVVKTALKVVSQCAWSCDSQWLFAGCEEKSTRRARLCVWNVEAATLVSAFQFDGTITALSAHPLDPTLVVVSYWNSRPVLLDVVSGKRIVLENVPLENEEMPQSTPQSNSKHPMLASCARYGRSGKRIYCATSKSTLAVLDAATLQCLDSLKLNVIVQFVDLCVNLRETAMLLTSSKGIHEFAMDSTTATGTSQHARDAVCTGAMEHPIGVREVALHSTGAVRAPWAVCCFSGGEEFVVGTPVVRHRHVGENGLFTWHRASKIGQNSSSAQYWGKRWCAGTSLGSYETECARSFYQWSFACA